MTGAPSAIQSDAVLTASDRCDRCGAAAKVKVMLSSGGSLYFCGHHANAHKFHLAEINARIEDFRQN